MTGIVAICGLNSLYRDAEVVVVFHWSIHASAPHCCCAFAPTLHVMTNSHILLCRLALPGCIAVVLCASAFGQTQEVTPGTVKADGSASTQASPPPPPPPDTEGALPMSFTESAVEKGANAPGFGRGTAMVDLDNDGKLDLVITNSEGPDALMRQGLDGHFRPMNILWNSPMVLDRSWGVLAADFDNDGDVDLYYPNGGFSGPQINTMVRNDLNVTGEMVNATALSGDAGTNLASNFGGTVLDYDKDGDLDIFLTPAATAAVPNPVCTLLRNDGNLVFTDVTVAADINEPGDYRHCSSGDIDNDGWMDIVVGNFHGDNRLYHNNGDGTFTDIATSAGVADPLKNFGMVLDDFNNDGLMDIFIAKYQFVSQIPSGLLLNNGDLTFRDVRIGSGMTVQGDMGHNVGDMNADGFPDIFIGTGHPNTKRMDSVKFVRPSPTGGLQVIEAAGGSGFHERGPTRAHGIAFGDIDRDGDIDVYVNNGGPAFFPASWEINNLFLADGNSNNWTSVRLHGIKSNKDAVGARGAMVAQDGRTVYRTRLIGKGFCNTDAPDLHFGLGESTGLMRLNVEWPSGLKQTHLGFPEKIHSDLFETAITYVGTPTVGGNITVNVYGPPNGTVTLFHGRTQAEIEDWIEGGIYTMDIPRTFESTLPIGPTGKVNVTFTVPNDPGLSGAQLFLQAKIEDTTGTQPTTLTNGLVLDVQ